MARKKKMSVSQVYGKLLKRREALQKDIDNSGDPLVVKPAMDSLAELDNKINQLRDLQQSRNGNNGEELMKYGGKMPMYPGGGMIKRADGSYSKRGLWDNIRANKGSGKKPTKEMLKQERKIEGKKYGGKMPMYQKGGKYDPYNGYGGKYTKIYDPRSGAGYDSEVDFNTWFLGYGDDRLGAGMGRTNTVGNVPRATVPYDNIALEEGFEAPEEQVNPNEDFYEASKEMRATKPLPTNPPVPGQAPIVNRDASYYGMDPEWTTPPESRERGLGANYGDYLTMGAKMLPIASDILDATRKTDYQKATDFPYKQALLRRREYIEDPRKVEAVTRGREDYRRGLRDATGGSAQQYLLGSLAGDVKYGQAEASAIAEAERDRARFEQAEDARIAGALGQLGEFEVGQQMMEEDERRRAEAARRGFRRGAAEKVAGFATAEEEKAYQMGALRDLYANFDYDEKTKRWVPKNMA